MENLLLNDILASRAILDAMKNMDPRIMEASDAKAKEICGEIFPDVNFGLQENIDLVVRPLSAVIALNEMVLQEMYQSTSLDGVLSSATIPDQLKVQMFQNFAKLNNIPVVSSDPASLYSEITQKLFLNNINNMEVFTNDLYEDFPFLTRLFFVDDSMSEMERNKIPYIQINHAAIMDFERSEYNRGTLLNGAYNRDDYQTYQEYKESDRVTIPGMLDVYFGTKPIVETTTVQRSADGFYYLPEGYYIDISCNKPFEILEDDTMRWGIAKLKVGIDIENGDENEEITHMRYLDPLFENYKNKDALVVRDVMYKGFFPLLVHFTLYTKEDLDPYAIRDAVVEYLDSISGSIELVSVANMQSFLAEKGFRVVVSSNNAASLFVSVGAKVDMDTVFPLTMRDITVPPELKTSQISEKTIMIFAGDIHVVKE